MPAPNNLITTKMVLAKNLAEFKNYLTVIRHFNMEFWKRFGIPGAKIGTSLQVPRPQRWQSTDGADYVQSPIDNTTVTININQQKHIGFQWPSLEGALSLDNVFDNYFRTSIEQLANDTDDAGITFAMNNTSNTLGVVQTNPSTNAEAQSLMLRSSALLQSYGANSRDLQASFQPGFSAAMQSLLNANFNPTGLLGRQYESGVFQAAFGIQKITVDQNIRQHTVGTLTAGGNITVKTASVNGDTSIVLTGFTPGATVNPGDSFDVADVYGVNPLNRRSFGVLKTFANGGGTQLVADGSGDVTVPLAFIGAKGLQGPGQYQNVDALPAADAVVTFWRGTSAPGSKVGIMNLLFGRDSFAFCPVDLEKLPALECEKMTDPETGIVMMITRGGDIKSLQTLNRLDIAFGFGPLNCDGSAMKIMGASGF